VGGLLVVARETFSFDPFGNITETGSIAFQPTYSTTTNRISTLPGFPTPPPPAYDANGNLTNDSVHTYSWDAEGKVLGVDTTSLTYDALGRMSLCFVIPDMRRFHALTAHERAAASED
jgi:YD repeat-containing protein